MASCGQSCTSTGSAFLHQVHPLFLKLPISSFFFRIHTDDWIACRLKIVALFGNMLELCIALLVASCARWHALYCVWESILLPKKFSKRGAADAVSRFSQFGAQVLQRAALGHRVACCFACQKLLQRRLENRIARLKRGSSSAGSTQLGTWTERQIGRQLPLATPDGHKAQTGNLRDQASSAMAHAAGFKRGKPPSLWLIQAAYENVHLMVMGLLGMQRVRETLWTPACMHCHRRMNTPPWGVRRNSWTT
jgi:hypothetical protein